MDTNTKTFRLEIDRDVFVGHPIHIREEDKKKAKQSKKTKKKKRKMTEAIPELHASYSATTSIDKKNVANVSLFNVVFALRYAKDSDKEMNNTYIKWDMSKCAEYVMFEQGARISLHIITLHTDRNSCSKCTIEMHARIHARIRTIEYTLQHTRILRSSTRASRSNTGTFPRRFSTRRNDVVDLDSVTSLSYHRERYDEENKTKQSWRSRALELSSLARELKDLYCQLNHKDRSHALDLKWHRWLKLSFVLSNPSREEAQDSTFRP